ncbi:MAG TPA: phosphoadenylyl-sulfate reductase [Candidatus Thioglobus sp.]|jgi:phosphoadenosine phosphosulfate reductase|nr:phosphoadenylyl-sulfate reductase [Candidatus Thioglobus sp.]HIL41927.1 phosphoadenylyl-sulfate reductase [Gammaproteobacteria bacterium]|tara:strand:- start:356 stop:1102 length:747 start_codon:yes stop_codon:yes gene_type:complete
MKEQSITTSEDVFRLVNGLTLNLKIERSLDLINDAYNEYGDNLVVANSLGKDSCVVWDLAKRVSSKIKGFIVTTPFKPLETKAYMRDFVKRFPETKIFESSSTVEGLYATDPDGCCEIYKVEPTREALEHLQAECWVTGLRCTEGRTRTDYREIEYRDEGLAKLNPILIWEEREIWQYLAMNQIRVNGLYEEGYRSLGCTPCTSIVPGDERSGRWASSSKCGGECGIHTRPLKREHQCVQEIASSIQV